LLISYAEIEFKWGLAPGGKRLPGPLLSFKVQPGEEAALPGSRNTSQRITKPEFPF
jgi:hypothetical protein